MDKTLEQTKTDNAGKSMKHKKFMAKPGQVEKKWFVVDATDKVVFTGRKWQNKRYTWNTGYPRLRSESAAERFEKKPEMILREAVRRMLPKNKLAGQMLTKLKLYTGDAHPHQAQQPEALELAIKK